MFVEAIYRFITIPMTFYRCYRSKWVENKVLDKNYLSPDFNISKSDDALPKFFSKKLGWTTPFTKKIKKIRAQLCGPAHVALTK